MQLSCRGNTEKENANFTTAEAERTLFDICRVKSVALGSVLPANLVKMLQSAAYSSGKTAMDL